MAEIGVHRVSARTTVIRLTGELDLHQALDLRPWLLMAIQLACVNVVVDVAALSFLD